jgi:hypothetical protein
MFAFDGKACGKGVEPLFAGLFLEFQASLSVL